MSVYLLGRRIDCMNVSSIAETIKKACIENQKITLASYNIHGFNLSMQLPWYYRFLQDADITICDSVGILKAISLMGLDLPLDYRASYTLLMPKVLEICNQHELSIFLLGGKLEYLQNAIDNLKNQYPKAYFSGHHGYFDKEDPEANKAIIEQINDIKPNILLVGMGMPIQENWVHKHCGSLKVNTIMIGGAIIDRMAGIVPNCPHIISNAGFEWLYRLLREPKRLAVRYLLGNPAFMLHLVFARLNKFKLQVKITPKL
ncbi:WecB/TagA/CpsF family glycosyltransferase [Mastigocoleus sp. MO_188.B34]|uniref:WecB/TagA/CpsF family glycosyltransferase n=1 Tax=Mastigocoleus sp. MO_188.B34 TaxID=3036635 RepID=UPI002614794B|nr:WecB/TagA/CpsF family glycosyltransferase [Mastigocoleus sp. MO_188.B34]MDJ0696983.1 WecB/TagA/CpsF family glycosyltransferase [Mastigocoleus sp. MO_188.B34]